MSRVADALVRHLRPARAAALLAALLLPAALPSAAADLTADPWRQARRLADEARYDSALAVLRGALTERGDDFGLRWLEAGITGEAGRHRQAVARYERLRADHPARADELLCDLAAQRLAAGDVAGAERDYRARLALHPDDAEAARGRARALGWMGRHGEAVAAYRDLLARDPDDDAARLGLAMNENWDGRHRDAARRLEKLAHGRGADPEALKALAFARYWDGDPDGARRALDSYLRRRPDDAEAQGLSRRLRREAARSLRFEFGRADDSDGLRVDTPALTLGLPLSTSTTAWLGWRDDCLSDDGDRRTLRRVTAGLQQTAGPAWTLYGHLSALHWGPDAPGTPLVGDLGVISRPVDRVRLEAVVAREPVLTLRSVELGVSRLDWIGAVDVSPAGRLRLHADGRLGCFSDGNGAERLGASAGWRAFARPRGEVTLLAAVTQLNVHADPGHGYYAPDFHREWGPGADAEWRPSDEQSFGVTSRFGWQHDKGGETQSFYTLAGRAEVHLAERWTAALQAGHGNSSLQNATTGYERTFWQAALTLRF